jgi:uncharacterized membrane protein YtjA (UPF0391 family)
MQALGSAQHTECIAAAPLQTDTRRTGAEANCRGNPMLHYAVVFLVIALIAAVFGFGGIAASAVGIAKILFMVFIVLAVVTFLIGLLKR